MKKDADSDRNFSCAIDDSDSKSNLLERERKVSVSLLQYSKAMDMRTAGEVNSIADLMVTQM